MNIFVKAIFSILAITLYSTALATGTTTAAPRMHSEPLIMFQVIQNQLVVDSSMIESATIISPTNSLDSYGLQLKLKKTAADELARISEENIGKRMNMVLGGVVISSPKIQGKLDAEFQMTGLTKKQAEQCIKSLALPK